MRKDFYPFYLICGNLRNLRINLTFEFLCELCVRSGKIIEMDVALIKMIQLFRNQQTATAQMSPRIDD